MGALPASEFVLVEILVKFLEIFPEIRGAETEIRSQTEEKSIQAKLDFAPPAPPAPPRAATRCHKLKHCQSATLCRGHAMRLASDEPKQSSIQYTLTP